MEENKFDYDVFDLNSYDYYLPEELIAQSPAEKRDESRLLTLCKDDGKLEDKHFFDILDYLKPGDVIVRNNTKVIPARLIGEKKETGAHVEVLLLHPEEDKVNYWEALVGNARVVKIGTVVSFGPNEELKAICREIRDEGLRVFELIYEGILYEVLDKLGKMPLPPYIHEKLEDKDRYQTVYAKNNGSAAAPTAGLHFTKELLKAIEEKGINICYITLHVGLGTFRPVNVEDVTKHVMHTEHYIVTKEAADKLNEIKANGGKIIAVGTTSVRTLETVISKNDKFVPSNDDTNIICQKKQQTY